MWSSDAVCRKESLIMRWGFTTRRFFSLESANPSKMIGPSGYFVGSGIILGTLWAQSNEAFGLFCRLLPALGLFYPPVDMCHVTDYSWRMIKTFADKETLELYETGKSKRLPPDIRRRAVRRLEYLDMATGLEDLKVPPDNRLHELQRERKGQYSISVNDQWRICFRFEDGDAYDVELTDYH